MKLPALKLLIISYGYCLLAVYMAASALGRSNLTVNSRFVTFLAARMKCIFRCLQFRIAEFAVVTTGTTKLYGIIHSLDILVGQWLMLAVVVTLPAGYSQAQMHRMRKSG